MIITNWFRRSAVGLLFWTLLASVAICQEEEETGVELYRIHCAGCHGITGDGKGTTKLETPARSFKEGRFAFGNTPEQLLKTISSGIPGRSKMPSFADILDDSQKQKIVTHVRTLLPEEKTASRKETELRIENEPVVVRGHFPAIVPGAPERPRALLVGLPGGLSFEYRRDDLRLLGVRQGAFLHREDWNGRGGTPVQPLGTLMYVTGEGHPAPIFFDENFQPFKVKLRATRIEGTQVVLEQQWTNAAGEVLAQVEERPSRAESGSGFGFRREFVVQANSNLAAYLIAPTREGSAATSSTLETRSSSGLFAVGRSSGTDSQITLFRGIAECELQPGTENLQARFHVIPRAPLRFSLTTILLETRDTAAMKALLERISK